MSEPNCDDCNGQCFMDCDEEKSPPATGEAGRMYSKLQEAEIAILDLLEALEEALENWDDDHFDEEYPYRIEWADRARAAINKARGER